jgi:hypothetical protein
VRDNIDCFVEKRLWPLELKEGIDLSVRYDIQHANMWWRRFNQGEREWRKFMCYCADEDTKAELISRNAINAGIKEAAEILRLHLSLIELNCRALRITVLSAVN